MARQASSSSVGKNFFWFFLLSFAFFAFLNTGLSFIFTRLFTLLISVPTFSMIALFALILTLVYRQHAVEEVPYNQVGLLMTPSGSLKDILEPGPRWLWLGREHIGSYLALDPISTQVSLLGLKSSDGVALSPLTMITTWRILPDIHKLFHAQYRYSISQVALESQWQRERRVGERVAQILRPRVAQKPLSDLEQDLGAIQQSAFGHAVIREINTGLLPMGLKVERLECIGSLTTPTKAAEAVKTISAARLKLESLLRPRAPDPTLPQIDQRLANLQQRARLVEQQVRDATHAVNDYVQAIIDVLEPFYQQAASKPDMQAMGTTGKKKSQRMNTLSQEVLALLEELRKTKALLDQLKRPPFDLTPDELNTLFKVLEAIEQKKLLLSSLFP